MPQINRIRVNNVKYNFGTQFYDDFLMRFSCRNSMYDLANGGGKSVLMLLLLQNLIPNCTLDDKQPMEKLFRSGCGNTVIHSLIEWKLDDCDIRSGYRYMLTGFCARKAKESAEEDAKNPDTASVEYFNYCIFYKESGANDIKNLPLSDGEKRITYNGLKSYLRELEKRDYGTEVRIFDKKGDYQNFISNYGLYESQWEIIRGINRTEGHVRTYFENTYRTTRKVIEDLLIEGIIEKSYNNRIRKGEDDDSQMAETLLDIKEKLIELAKKREEINNYDEQTALLNSFSERLSGLKNLYTEKTDTENLLIKYLLICRKLLAGEKKKMADIKEKIERLEISKNETARLEAAAEIESEMNELDKTDSLIEETLARKEILCNDKKRIENELRLYKAAEDYSDYTENRKKYDELKALMNGSSMDRSDAVAEMGRLAATKFRLMNERKEKLISEHNLYAGKAAALKTDKDEADNMKLNAYGLVNKNSGLVEELRNEILNINSSLDSLMNECGIATTVNLKDELSGVREDINAVKERINSINDMLEKEREKYADFRQRITENNAKISLAGEEMDRCSKELEKDRELIDRLENIKRIYSEQDVERLIARMSSMLNSLGSEIVRNKDELDHLKKEELCIKEKKLPDYDKQFNEILDYLAKRYPDVKSGADILSETDEEKRMEMITAFPQMVYSVFAGESYESILRDPSIHKLDTGSFIIPVFPAAILEEGINPYGSMAVSYRDITVFFDEAAAKPGLDRLADEIEKLTAHHIHLTDRYEVIEKDMFDCRYILSGTASCGHGQKLKKLRTEYEQLNSQKEEYAQSLDNIRENINSYSGMLEREKQRLSELNEEEQKINNVITISESLNRKNVRLKECEAELKHNKREYSNLEKKTAHLISAYDEAQKAFKSTGEELERIDEEFDAGYKMFYDEGVEGYSDMAEEDVDSAAGAVRKILQEEMGSLADKERLLATYEDAMNKAVGNLRYNDMTIDAAREAKISGLLVKASIEERMQLKDSLALTEEKIRTQEDTLNSEQAHRNRIEGSIWHGQKVYEEKYGIFQKEGINSPETYIISCRQKISELTSAITAANKEYKDVEEADRDLLLMEKDITRIIKSAGIDIDEKAELAEEEFTDDFSAEKYEYVQKKYEKICREEQRRKNIFEEDKQKLSESLAALKAYDLAEEVKRSIKVPENNSEIDLMLNNLNETNECIMLEKDNIQRGITDMQKIKENFEERCIQICINIRTELDRLPKFSRITLDDETVPMLTLSIPYIKEELYRERMSVYINEIVSCAETFALREEKYRYIKSQLSWKKLFSVIVADMNSIKLCLYKRERIKSRSRYLRYEEAVGSTGQSQGIYIQFLIAVIHYISSINSAGKDAGAVGKTIFIDNPFGAAKDVYIWEPIFKLLKTNHVQLIVPARGATPAITGMFDVNYILGQKMAGDRQQTVVVDYRSHADTEGMDYQIMEYEQTVLNLD